MNNIDLTNGDIRKHIKNIAVPASIGFFFNTMYNVVDTYFGGLISTDALAALSLSFPVFFIIIAMGSGISTGATALIANALGAKEDEKARVYSLQAISFSVLIGFMLTLVGFYISPFLFKILGAEGAYLETAVTYINIILLGSVFFGLTFVINGILNARGDTVTFRNFLIVGFFLNLFLNPVFMFGWFGFPVLGFAGVAWATVVIQLVGVVYMFRKLMNSDIFCSGCGKLFMPQLSYFREIAGQGFPASLNMMTVAIGIFVITYFISPFGKEAVAAYGIATRIDQIALLPTIGLNIAALAMVGQNYGAKKFERCREIFYTLMRFGFYVSMIGALGVLIFARPLMTIFTNDQELINIGVKYLHISIFVYFAYTILFLVVAMIQGLKKPNFAIWIGIYRQIVAPLAIFYLFSSYFGWGLTGIWWGIFTINWSATVISFWYARTVMKKVFIN